MSTATRKRRHKAHHEEEHENEERWLVSFADMMTLLMCLFMVLFSISSVNTSKFEALQRALQDAFSGRILPGGQAIRESGASETSEPAPPQPPIPAIKPLDTLSNSNPAAQGKEMAAAARLEEDELQRLKRRIEKIAAEQGFKSRISVTVRQRGLVVQLLTDKVFFDSGRAVLKAGATGVLDKVGAVIRDERRHPVIVEGYTDSQPIATGQFPSNWHLSGARAAAVTQQFLRVGLSRQRVSISGYAEQHPVASNSSAQGRARNRRVEVVLSRIHTNTTAGRRP